MFLDFLEIGTAHFHTEVQTAWEEKRNLRGVSVEPVRTYLDQLPALPRCHKVHGAISDRRGYTIIHYVPPEWLEQCRLPSWLAGCNSVDRPHPTVQKVLKASNLPMNLIQKEIVEVYDFAWLYETFRIEGIRRLKIDTEGHDTVILRDYAAFCQKVPSCRALEIVFESNELTSRKDLTETIVRLASLGYELESSATDTVLHLDPQVYPYPLPEYYFLGHPDGYDPKHLPHENTLESARAYASQLGEKAGGVTYENGMYTVRSGSVPHFLPKPQLCSYFLTNQRKT